MNCWEAEQGDNGDIVQSPRRLPGLPGNANEPFIRCDQWNPARFCKGQVDAIVCGVIERQRKLENAGQIRLQCAEFNLYALQEPGREAGFDRGNLSPLHLLPEDVRAFRLQQCRRKQSVSEESQCLGRSILRNDPFDRDACIDNERAQRSSRPSRCKTSAGVCTLPAVNARNSAASSRSAGEGASVFTP